MEVRPWPLRAASQDLSKAERFALGPLTVDPPTRRVGNGARDATLEPRVMRVLVALATAESKVVSRDDLVELCWDGLIVGDNAINRVISRLRQTFADLAGDEVRLETITKVGFRLVSSDQAGFDRLVSLSPIDKAKADATISVRARPRTFDRRRFAVGSAAAAAVAALGYSGWVRATAHRPDPEAVQLLNRGNTVMRS
ncbi:MAG: winged helix-turn-helix domain-containing protein, partial [Sphingomicrobium sp.]